MGAMDINTSTVSGSGSVSAYRSPVLGICRLIMPLALVPTLYACISIPETQKQNTPFTSTEPSNQADARLTLSPPIQAASTLFPTLEADSVPLGKLHLIVGGWSERAGWSFHFLAAQNHEGFKRQTTPAIQSGQHLNLLLIPDRYHLLILRDGQPVGDRWVEIMPGQSTVIYVDIGMTSTNISKSLHEDKATQRINKAAKPVHALNWSEAFGPLIVTLSDKLESHWYGPRQVNTPIGTGRLELYADESKIAIIDPAEVDENGSFIGVPEFEDGRVIDGKWQGDKLSDDSITHFPDGRQFQGNYTGATPHEGKLQWPDGKQWEGRLNDNQPDGAGQLTLSDGTVLHDVLGADIVELEGVYQCTTPTGQQNTCAWFEGQAVASKLEYERHVNARTMQETAKKSEQQALLNSTQDKVDPMGMSGLKASVEQAQQALLDQASESELAVLDLAQSVPLYDEQDGCARVQGQFATSTGLSRLSFNPNGQGQLWQRTYQGSSHYIFEVGFTWSGSADAMRFDYGPAVYRDANGREVQRTSLPGGSATCSYNGQALNIGGTVYYLQ